MSDFSSTLTLAGFVIVAIWLGTRIEERATDCPPPAATSPAEVNGAY